MIVVSSTEVKTNFGKYMDLLDKEDVIVTKNGKYFAKLTLYDKKESYKRIKEILLKVEKENITDEEIKIERLKKYD